MGIIRIKVKGKHYEINDNTSYDKWKKMYFETTSILDKMNWFKSNVILTEINDFSELALVVRAVELKFGFTDNQFKEYMKECGKVGRGIQRDGFSSIGFKYSILKHMNGAIVSKIPFEDTPIRDLIFYKRMMDVEHQMAEEARAQAEAKAREKAKGRK